MDTKTQVLYDVSVKRCRMYFYRHTGPVTIHSPTLTRTEMSASLKEGEMLVKFYPPKAMEGSTMSERVVSELPYGIQLLIPAPMVEDSQLLSAMKVTQEAHPEMEASSIQVCKHSFTCLVARTSH